MPQGNVVLTMAVSSQSCISGRRRWNGIPAVILAALMVLPGSHGAPATGNCMEKSAGEFPTDLFTEQQRQKGAIILHMIGLVYALALMATVCQVYFVPALEIMAGYFKVPTDVAGATFMAMGTSAPELFSSVFGSFVAGGDIGVSTVLGSAVFNVVGVCGIIGLMVWAEALPIDWYPVTRDCSMYGLTVLVLVIFVWDNAVEWWEALVMIIMFILYLFFMYFNVTSPSWAQKKDCTQKVSERLHHFHVAKQPDETTPLLLNTSHKSAKDQEQGCSPPSSLEDSAESVNGAKTAEFRLNAWKRPSGGPLKQAWWLFIWPGLFLMHFTIPDCSKVGWKLCFPLTFLLSIVWIGCLSYISVWMVTVISKTFEIPDTISGFTLLAIGTSMPEAIGSIIVAKNGLGNMALCNLIGGNIFDILFCLGLPWLVKAGLFSVDLRVLISSSGVSFSAAALLTTVVALYLLLVLFRWKLDFRIGVACVTLYALYILLATLYELKIFGDFDVPVCE
ncbi:sodium/potassium/calcium exchanger 4-like [Ornithodoros turicata]|uniref:sodium/potassium/calcium exchanger 4-like n=1 Tax=Ornithodoros turicata TaxID=34597 RepID=UPI0031387217